LPSGHHGEGETTTGPAIATEGDSENEGGVAESQTLQTLTSWQTIIV